MSSTKNSTDWLQPIELDKKESERFQEVLEKPLSQTRLKQQTILFEIARETMNKVTNDKINIANLSIRRYCGGKWPAYFQYDKKDQFLVDFYDNDAMRLGKETITYTMDVFYKGTKIAYYAFTLGEITAKDLGAGRKLTKLTHPAIKLGMAFVTKPFQNRGVGTYILAQIVKVALKMREEAPIRFIVVDATPDAEAFYEKRGFELLRSKGGTILMLLDIDKLMKNVS